MDSHKLFHSLLCTALSCLLLGLCQRTTCHWPLKNGGNFHQSSETILHYKLLRIQCRRGVPKSIFGPANPLDIVSNTMSHYTTGSPAAIRLGLCNCLAQPTHWCYLRIHRWCPWCPMLITGTLASGNGFARNKWLLFIIQTKVDQDL